MTFFSFFSRVIVIVWMTVAIGACSSAPRVTRTMVPAESVDAPYDNVLVIFLFSSFDSRRYLETEVVQKLSELGVQATASTSLMDTRTPVVRETFLKMVEDIDADAVLVTQLANLDAKGTRVDMSPESTYNIRPTWYYNVWSVDLEEYVEPQAVDMEYKMSLATQLYSASAKDVVWAIESNSKIEQDFDRLRDYSIYVNEADAIVKSLAKDGMVGQ